MKFAILDLGKKGFKFYCPYCEYKIIVKNRKENMNDVIFVASSHLERMHNIRTEDIQFKILKQMRWD